MTLSCLSERMNRLLLPSPVSRSASTPSSASLTPEPSTFQFKPSCSFTTSLLPSACVLVFAHIDEPSLNISPSQAVTDRFFRALYASLFDPRLAGSSKQALYLNLVFKAMKADTDKKRVMACLKRLVQVMLGMDVTFILGSIWIVGEVRSYLCPSPRR